MRNQLSKQTRSIITSIFTLTMGMFIAWEYFYEGGVTTHYLLHSEDMSNFSSWWGLLLTPIFTWVATGFIKPHTFEEAKQYKSIFLGFLILFLFGLTLSYAFLIESDMTYYLKVAALLASAFFTPVYRTECLLGHLMGLLFTFGAIIPILCGTLFWLLFQLIQNGKTTLNKVLTYKTHNSGTRNNSWVDYAFAKA